jgi:DNA-binding response OmpR family regulator
MKNLTQAKVLVVDDNAFHLRIVEDAFSKANYHTIRAESGEAALAQIEAEGLPDLAIVDYTMPPGMNGFDFCQAVHEYSDMPTIMLTAVDEEEMIIEGLEQHAEDYMVKPFSPEELVARSQRVLKRVGLFPFVPAACIEVDDRLGINFPQRTAYIHDKKASLTPTETRLLYILMREAGEVVNTDFIIRRLWPLEPAFEDRLHVHMHRLRRKIEAKNNDAYPPYIISQRGEGYIFRQTTGVRRFADEQ